MGWRRDLVKYRPRRTLCGDAKQGGYSRRDGPREPVFAGQLCGGSGVLLPLAALFLGDARLSTGRRYMRIGVPDYALDAEVAGGTSVRTHNLMNAEGTRNYGVANRLKWPLR